LRWIENRLADAKVTVLPQPYALVRTIVSNREQVQAMQALGPGGIFELPASFVADRRSISAAEVFAFVSKKP
jgi:predicted transcriptional regulator YheO